MLSFAKNLLSIGLAKNRHIHTSILALANEHSPLFLLRKKTGLSYSLCREALNKHQDNVQEAEDYLKAHAMAHGLQKASKVRDRSTREGLVCLAVPKNNLSTTIVELNCETDFVAKNQLFRDFAIDVGYRISNDIDEATSHKLPDQDIICGLKPNAAIIKDIESQIMPLITRLGENIKLSKVLHLRASRDHESIKLFGQIHGQAGKKITDDFDIMAGRFGAIVALKLAEEAETRDHEKIRAIGNRLCQHVIGYNPAYIELPPNIRKHLEEMEKEREQIASSENKGTADESHDDIQVAEKSRNRDDWPSIMDQTLVMSDDLTVRDLCENSEISIVYFNRLECGMESW